VLSDHLAGRVSKPGKLLCLWGGVDRLSSIRRRLLARSLESAEIDETIFADFSANQPNTIYDTSIVRSLAMMSLKMHCACIIYAVYNKGLMRTRGF
jgi:hypothetical protein